MLKIVCGEDTILSRNFIIDLKETYRKKNVEIHEIAPKDLVETITKSQQTASLFSNSIVFFTTNLNSFVSKLGRTIPDYISELALSKDVEIVDWEEGKGSRELKIAKLGEVKEFKPTKNVFQLLDICYPGNRKIFLTTLATVSDISDEIFIYTMLSRHIRSLILAKENVLPSSVHSWQRAKLYKQAEIWTTDKLLGFYEGLHRIDVGLKTSSNPFGVTKSLDILVCFFL